MLKCQQYDYQWFCLTAQLAHMQLANYTFYSIHLCRHDSKFKHFSFNFRNWNDVKTCILDNVMGCNDATYHATMSGVLYTLNKLRLPVNCLGDTEWWRKESAKDLPFIEAADTLMVDIAAVIMTKDSTICDAFKTYMDAMDSATLSPFLTYLGEEWYSQWTAVIKDYCGQGKESSYVSHNMPILGIKLRPHRLHTFYNWANQAPRIVKHLAYLINCFAYMKVIASWSCSFPP